MYSFLKKTQQGRAEQVIWGEKSYESIFLSSKDFTSVCLCKDSVMGMERSYSALNILFFSLPCLDFFSFPHDLVSGDRNCPDRNMTMTTVACCCLFEIRLPCIHAVYYAFYVLSPCTFSCLSNTSASPTQQSMRRQSKKGGTNMLGDINRNGFEHLFTLLNGRSAWFSA